MKRPLIPTALTLGSLLIFFLLAEVSVRILGVLPYDPRLLHLKTEEPRDKSGSIPSAYTPNGAFYYEYPDNPRGYFDADNRVTGRVNSHGYRGPDRPPEKPEGLKRIVLLGDSFAWGYGVRDEDTISAVAEEELKRLVQDQRIEVLNFAVTGHTTTDEVAYLKSYALRFQPDIVLIAFFLNDVSRGSYFNLAHATHERFNGLRTGSRFANLILGQIERIVVYRELVRHYRSGFTPEDPEWKRFTTAIEEARALSREKGFTLMLVLYPAMLRLDAYPFRAQHAILREFCKSQDIRFRDLLPAVEGGDDTALRVHAEDLHPNEIAQRRMGELLATFLAPMLQEDPRSDDTP